MYSIEAQQIYRAILKCYIAVPDKVLKHLGASNVENEEGNLSHIDKDDVILQLEYSNENIVKKSLDDSKEYLKNSDEIKKMLEIDNLDMILSDSCEEARRLFNMIIEHKTLEDKDVTLKSLVPLHIVNNALFILHSNGFVLLKYSAAKESKPILQWQDSFTYDCRGNQEKTERWIGSGGSEIQSGKVYNQRIVLFNFIVIIYVQEIHISISCNASQ